MQRAVFLDRDGVLNRLVVCDGRAVSPRALAEFALLPGVRAAVEALRRAALRVIVVTNQPDIARGALSLAELERMHTQLLRAVPVDAIYTCPHDDLDGCACRKPKSGLFHGASRDWNIHLEASFLVGDSWKDIAAGRAVGCTTILVASPESHLAEVTPNFAVHNLPAAAELILGRIGKRSESRATQYVKAKSG